MDRSRAAGTGDLPDCSCKVGRVARARALAGLDAALCERREAGVSLRDLEAYVNVTVLERALERASAEVLGDVEGIYRGLTGEEVSAGERTELVERLDRADVDVEALESAFVSYQTVRSHLQECLGVDTGRSDDLDPEDALGTIAWARARSEGVAERTLERLARDGALDAGDLAVSQVVRVSCVACGVTAPVDAFVERGGCDCDTPAAAVDSDGGAPDGAAPPDGDASEAGDERSDPSA